MEFIEVIYPIVGKRYYGISGKDEFGLDHYIEGIYSCETIQVGMQSYYTKNMLDGKVVSQLFIKKELIKDVNSYRLVTNPILGKRYYGISGKDEFGEDHYIEGIYSCETIQVGMQSYYTKNMLDGKVVSQLFIKN